MNVTDEMVEAGAISDAAFDGRDFAALGRADKARYRERSRKGLEAALAAMPQPVAVKPLHPRDVGEAVIDASDVADETLAIDGKTLVMSPGHAITINLTKLAKALASLTTPAQGAQPSEEDDLRAAARNIVPYLMWTIGEESPGHHPTMPSAVSAFMAAFGWGTDEKWQEDRIDAIRNERSRAGGAA